MPSYQFNHFTGRLKESSHLQPLYPISPLPLQSADPPKMVYDSIKTKPVSSGYSTVTAMPKEGRPLPEKMARTMAAYQKNLDTPVYLIRGTPDKILFGITCVGTVIGGIWAFSFLISKTSPPKQ